MENDCKIRKVAYSSLSQYTKNVGKGFQLSHEYMEYSREAVREDERAIIARKAVLNGLEKLTKK